MSTTSTTKWIEPPPLAEKNWFLYVFGSAVIVITSIALLTNTVVFVISLLFTLCCVGYLVHRQIEQAQHATHSLFESEQRFRLLVDEVYEYAIFAIDPQGKVMSWNAGAARMLGYVPNEILAKPLDGLCVNESEGGIAVEAVLAKAVSEGRVQVECWFVRSNGTRLLGNAVITPMESNSGTLSGFSVIVSDITARREAEESLKTSHRFIQRVTDAVPDLLFIVDLSDERVMFINREGGFKTGDLDKTDTVTVRQLFHTEDVSQFDRLKDRCATLKDGAVYQFEARQRKTAGDWRHVSIRAVVFSRDEKGAPTQTLCLAQDLTELKQAQEDKRRFEQVALSRERLALLGELSASVAHEFRNPLLGVQHCVEELRARTNGQKDDVVELLAEGVSRMDHVSERLLRLARNDDGVRHPTDLAVCIEGTCGFVRSHAQKAGIQIDTEIEPNLPAIPLQAERLSEALLNLIYNAIDACEPGERVCIKVRSMPEISKIELLVSDSGAGIPAEIKDKIFEAFFTTKVPGRGTGLGMTIVRRIIEAHRGSIELMDQTSKGSTFRILLPMS